MTENPLLERATRFVSALRHCQVLGITAHQASEEGITLIMPYARHLVGDPQTGVIHGGALTSLMDTACGMVPCAYCRNSRFVRPSTCVSTTCIPLPHTNRCTASPNATG